MFLSLVFCKTKVSSHAFSFSICNCMPTYLAKRYGNYRIQESSTRSGNICIVHLLCHFSCKFNQENVLSCMWAQGRCIPKTLFPLKCSPSKTNGDWHPLAISSPGFGVFWVSSPLKQMDITLPWMLSPRLFHKWDGRMSFISRKYLRTLMCLIIVELI